MAHVFVSYHHSSLDVAVLIQQQLEAAGFTVWLNPDEQAGEVWFPWIEPYIRDSFVMVAVFTPAARASEQVAYEWIYACGAGCEVIPVLGEPTDLHPKLAGLEPLDFSHQQTIPWGALIVRVQDAARRYGSERLAAPDGSPSAVIEAADALHSFDEEHRRAAVEALAQMDEPEAQIVLAAAAQHPIYRSVRLAAIDKLAQIGGDVALNGLLAALTDTDNDSDVCRAAAEAVSRFGDAAVPGLVAVAHSGHRTGSRAAIWALSQIKSPATVPGLIEGLKMRGWFGPRTAAVTLGEIGDPRAVPALIQALHSEDEHLAALAVEALRKIGTPEALAAVESYAAEGMERAE